MVGHGYWFDRGGMATFKRANEAANLHWFDGSTMRFFRSRVGELLPGDYFVSSERHPDGVRRYTLRRAELDSSVTTIGEFQAYATRAQALAAYRRRLRADGY